MDNFVLYTSIFLLSIQIAIIHFKVHEILDELKKLNPKELDKK